MTGTQMNQTTRVFRAFVKDTNGRPLCGSGDCMLGARVPTDIRPDDRGLVHPSRGGMSVTPDDPARLPLHFRPISMGGAGALPVFALNLEMLGNDLSYRADPKKPSKHGFIEPAAPVHVEEYQRALATTAPAWLEVA